MIRVDLLIFDLDGTLADTKGDIAQAVNLTLKQFHLPEKDPKIIYGYVGDGVRALLIRAFEDRPDEILEQALEVFRQHYMAHLLDTTRLYPGVLEVVDSYGDKKRVIATNKPFEYTRRIIEGLGVQDRFDLVLAGDHDRDRKPRPAMILKALQRWNIPPARAVMIGDGVNDILAARAAGIYSCAVGYGLGRREELLARKPDYFCEEIGEIKNLLS